MGEPAVGIDLGTSNTVIAVVQDDQAVVIPDAEGRRVHPSVVSFHPNGTVLIGQEAKRRRAIDPANTIFSVKRLIGRTYDSEAVQSAMWYQPYKIIEGANRQPLVVARGREYAVPEISAMVLRHVCRLAEEYIGEKIEKAVVTVPANFNDAQREATRVAGRIAGLNVLRIVNEPTAAALAYGYDKGLDNQVAIYDFGGGTFDISILQLHDQVFEVISTAGDTCLGGDDIDYRLVRHMIEMLAREHRIDLSDHLPAINRLGAVAERIKCQLSTHGSAMVKVQEIAYAEGGVPVNLEFELTVDQLNQLAMELIQRSFLICDEALGLAGTTTTQIDDVILVGGSTKMPLVRRSVREYFNMEPRTDINPDEVVAVGAAIQAATLLNASVLDHRGVVLLDVTPRAMGIAVVGGYTDVIIERNAQIPIEQTRRFTTSRDNQEVVRIQVCQGEAKHYDENQPLGELVLENLRPAPRGDVQVEVTFEIDTDGILQVQARDLDTGRRQQARMQILGVASADDIERMVEGHAAAAASQEMPAAVP